MDYGSWEPVIGLEIHAQLSTKSKLFCSDSTSFGSGDNENTGPVSLGMPGTLPVLNQKAVEYAVKIGLALNCEINKTSIFARKNYFYPDMSKGYQISQYEDPICLKGSLDFFVDGEKKTINLTRAHLEEDAAKSIHEGNFSLINFNRAGVPLLEIVTEPEISTPKEASEYARAMRNVLRYLDVCDGDLEKGSLRCDCNISVRRKGEKKLGTKVEIKNVNSFRFVEKSLEFEIQRQIDSLEGGQTIYQETRLYDVSKNKTFSMRAKEDANDYRYFPEPDLPPLKLESSYIEQIKGTLPELPMKKMERFQKDYGLSFSESLQLTEDKTLAFYYEKVARGSNSPKLAASWLLVELMGELNKNQMNISESPINGESLAELVKLISESKISGKIAKTVIKKMWVERKSASEIVTAEGLAQVSDEGEIDSIVAQVLGENENQVEQYKQGKVKVFGFFVGQVMKMSKGQANPEIVAKTIKKQLGPVGK